MYRVTRTKLPGDHENGSITNVYGISIDGGPEQWIGLAVEGVTYERNALVEKYQDDTGRVWARLAGSVGDRLWSLTHTKLLEAEIDRLVMRDEWLAGTSDDGHKDDARDFYRRMRLALIKLRRPIEDG